MRVTVRAGRRLRALAALSAITLVAGCAAVSTTSSPSGRSGGPAAASSTSAFGPGTGGSAALPRPDHTVVVVMENRGYPTVIDRPDAAWTNAQQAAVMTDWHGIAHPSQPNYLALFSGSTQGVTDNGCPVAAVGPNLAQQLSDAHLTFTGYSEALPGVGAQDCLVGRYARKHNPWVDFATLPAAVNQPFSAFPKDLAELPSVAFVVPDLCNDTHDCPVSQGDAWLRDNLSRYVTWAQTHNSLLVITWDEDDSQTARNRIPTLFIGPMVRPGRYSGLGNHYTMLRTIEALHGLPGIGEAGRREPVTGIWR